MQDPRILGLIAKQLSTRQSSLEQEELTAWLNENPLNRDLYERIKATWINGESEQITLRKRFTRKHLTSGLAQEILANFIGFVVGMWVSKTFTHEVLERKGLKNLFGLLGRKKKVVNDIPEWMQFCISVLLGFIVLELVLYFFQAKKHIIVLNHSKKGYAWLRHRIIIYLKNRY